MSSLMEFIQAIFNPLVVVFTISNLASMGLRVNIPAVLETVRNPGRP